MDSPGRERSAQADLSPSPTSLVRTISGFLPMLVCAAAGLWLPGLWRLPLLLLAQALAVGACAHALGYLHGRRAADLAARVALHAVLMAGFAAWLWLLTAWPLASLVARAQSGCRAAAVPGAEPGAGLLVGMVAAGVRCC